MQYSRTTTPTKTSAMLPTSDSESENWHAPEKPSDQLWVGF